MTVVLFTDALAVDLAKLRRASDVPIRLFGVGLPLTIAAGTVTGLALLPQLDVWTAAALATMLAPTDAALGLPVVTDRRLPSRIRQGPERRERWVAAASSPPSRRDRVRDPRTCPCRGHDTVAEESGWLLNAVTFLMFGAVLLSPALGELGWRFGVYAVLSLTVVRMLPVALAMVGIGMRRVTVAFVGWFRTCGLASIVFARPAADRYADWDAAHTSDAGVARGRCSVVTRSAGQITRSG